MKRAASAEDFKEESGEAEHGQAAIPDLRAVVPAPGPLVLGIELDLGGQGSGLIEVDLGAF